MRKGGESCKTKLCILQRHAPLEHESRMPTRSRAGIAGWLLVCDQKHEGQRVRQAEPPKLTRRAFGTEQVAVLDRALEAAMRRPLLAHEQMFPYRQLIAAR